MRDLQNETRMKASILSTAWGPSIAQVFEFYVLKVGPIGVRDDPKLPADSGEVPRNQMK